MRTTRLCITRTCFTVFPLLLLTHLSTPEDILNEENYVEEDSFLEAEIIIGSQTIPLVDFRPSVLRSLVADRGLLWPNKVVFYKFASGQFSDKLKDKVRASLKDIMDNSCVRFQVKSDQQTYLRLRANGRGCATKVGYQQGEGALDLHVGGSRCQTPGTVQHEFLHALGFWHEHTRPDRDQYVDIIWDNVKPGRMFNFMKRSKEEAVDFGLPYDYNSVMHYRYAAFAKTRGSPTVVPKHKEATKTMGQRIRMSAVDFAKLNRLYNCSREYYRGDDLLGKKFVFGKVEKPKNEPDKGIVESNTGEESEGKEPQNQTERQGVDGKKNPNESIENNSWWKYLRSFSKVAMSDDKLYISSKYELNRDIMNQPLIEGLVTRLRRQTSNFNAGSGKPDPMHPENSDSFAPQKILPELLKGVLNSDSDRPIVIQFAIYQPIVYKSANESDSTNEEIKSKVSASDKKDNKTDVEKEEHFVSRQKDSYSSPIIEEQQFNDKKENKYQNTQHEEGHSLQTDKEKSILLGSPGNYHTKPKNLPKPQELPEDLDKRVSVYKKQYNLPSQLSFNGDERYSVAQTDYTIRPKTHPHDQLRQEYYKDSAQSQAQKEIDTYYATGSINPVYANFESHYIPGRRFEDDPTHYTKPLNPLESGDKFTPLQDTDHMLDPNGESEIVSDDYHTEHTYFTFDSKDDRDHKLDRHFHSTSHLHESVLDTDDREPEEIHPKKNLEVEVDHFKEPISGDNYSHHDSKNYEKVKEEPSFTFQHTERSEIVEKRPLIVEKRLAFSNTERISSGEEGTDPKSERRVFKPQLNPEDNAGDYVKSEIQELYESRNKNEDIPGDKFGKSPNERNAKPLSQNPNEKVMSKLLSLQNSRTTGILQKSDSSGPSPTQTFDRDSQFKPKHDLFIEDDFTGELDKDIRNKKIEHMVRIRNNEQSTSDVKNKLERKNLPKVSVPIERRSQQTSPKISRVVSSGKREGTDNKHFDNEGLIEKPKTAKLNLDPRQALPLQVLGEAQSKKNFTSLK